tara:strand:- start:20145 stop:20312 length:168 start_codon:yes stop_codon:yes gene_type:complete
MAKRALDKVVVLEDGVKANPESITLAIDVEPLKTFKLMGLSVFVKEEEVDELPEI